jgi:CsoR family transcriptional regulator, copper-sensing transcriptional repressor
VNAETKQQLDRRLARVEGQIAGLRSMIREDRYCLDVLTQLSAARGALDQLGAELVTSHMKTCILGQGSESQHDHCESMTQEELLDELRTSLSRLLK